jgi:polyphosphate glucokinase
MTAGRLVRAVLARTSDWTFDAVSLGFPGPVRRGRPAAEPRNLGRGWTRLDFRGAFGRPVRIVNDAAMQALGAYEGRKMLFLGLGTGLGSAMVADGVLLPLELAHLPFRRRRSFEDEVGSAGLRRLGLAAWRRAVADAVQILAAATLPDEVVIGGGNVHRLGSLPRGARRGSSEDAFFGGVSLWNARRGGPARLEAACSARAGSR